MVSVCIAWNSNINELNTNNLLLRFGWLSFLILTFKYIIRLQRTFSNSYFLYKCEKVILSSRKRLRPSEARVQRPHEDKIIFLLEYRTLFFDTTCEKLNLGHAVLFDRARSVKKNILSLSLSLCVPLCPFTLNCT